MNVYIEIIIRLANDHLTDKEKRLVADRLNVPLTGPEPMTDFEKRCFALRESLEARKLKRLNKNRGI